MKNIILFTLFTLGFSHFIHAQVVEKYIDRNDGTTTVIEKVPTSDDEDILSTLSLNDYKVGEQIYIIDHTKEEEFADKKTIQQKANLNGTASQVKAETPERNPIGEKVKRKKKRTPRWKSDRRGKRSSSTCFRF